MRLVAKAILVLSLLAIALFGAMAAVSLHDYYIASDLPWREGDFRSVTTTNIAGLAIGLFGLLLYVFRLRHL